MKINQLWLKLTMNKITLFSLTILLFTFSCKSLKTDSVSDSIYPKEFPFNDSTYTILNKPSGWNRIFKNAKPTSLTELEINKIEDILKVAINEYNLKLEKYFQTENEKYPKNKRDISKFQLVLNKHLRQYVPVINQKGEKEIWVNFFCDSMYTDWKNHIVKVFDGGNCYFNIKVNLTTNSYSKLIVNGYG